MPNTEVIVLTDDQDNEFEVVLTTHELSTLQEQEAFIDADDDEVVEVLINRWCRKKTTKQLFVYSEDYQQALEITAPQDLEGNLTKLINMRLFDVQYFHEMLFLPFLENRFHFTVDRLRALPGMDEEKLALLSQHPDALERLQKQGVSLKRLATLEMVALTGLLTNTPTIVVGSVSSLGLLGSRPAVQIDEGQECYIADSCRLL